MTADFRAACARLAGQGYRPREIADLARDPAALACGADDALLEHLRHERAVRAQIERRERALTAAVALGGVLGLAFWVLSLTLLVACAETLSRF